MKVSAHKLNGKERLESMYQSLNPYSAQPFLFDWELVKKGTIQKISSLRLR